MTTEIRSGTVLPAFRMPLTLETDDGLRLVGELATPVDREPVATLVCLHPLPTHGGMMDSHVLRKAAWRLPALAGLAVLVAIVAGVVLVIRYGRRAEREAEQAYEESLRTAPDDAA